MALGSLANLPLAFGLMGFACANAVMGTPLAREYFVISTSATIRTGDPVVLLTSGKIRRANAADTAILGFAAEPSNMAGYMGGQFPYEPTYRDDRMFANNLQSDPRILVYVIDGQNEFIGKTTGQTAATNRGLTCDFAFAVTGIQPVITMGGATGATTYTYKVVPRTIVGQSNAPTTPGTTTTGNATLSATNYNIITWTAQTNAVEYEVWKLNTGTSLYELLGVQPAGTVTMNDIGQATNASTAIPATTAGLNNSGFMINVAASSVNIVQIEDFSLRSPLDTVTTTGVLVKFNVPVAKSQFLGAAAAGS